MKHKWFALTIALVSCLSFFPLLSYGVGNSNESIPDRQLADPVQKVNPSATRTDFLSKWLHMLDKSELTEIENSSVMAFAPQVPGDLVRILKPAGGEKGIIGFLGVLLLTAVSIGMGFLIVFAARRIAPKGIAQLEQLAPPTSGGLTCLWTGILRKIPSLISLLLLAIAITLFFLLFAGKVTIEGRMLFQFVFGTVLSIMVCLILGRIIFAPGDATVRPIKLDDILVKPLYRSFVTSVSLIFSGMLFMHFIRELGGLHQTVSWVAIVLGSAVMAVFACMVLYLRQPVSSSLLGRIEPDSSSWYQKQFAIYWHVPALLYLLVAWFIWIGQEMAGTLARNGSFIISLLIVPIYFVLSYAGTAIIASIVDSLGLGGQPDIDVEATIEETIDDHEMNDHSNGIILKANLVFRVFLGVVLAAWLLSLWGYPIPFAAHAVRAIFESLVILTLALICWQFVASFIERKIKEATPETTETEEDVDDEFGGASQMGRSQTLLPMLRKVVGSVLVVMVILIVVSSLGVNIGPLLAGAGVLGLAIGFGAQKLVSDVLSGFFFLLDDAFRIGEYIQAGKIRGTVEAITLRNVMLRHHLGMLQIVPHSDLGAVTNYMRGGIVIKFPLEFPYDTEIDKVRKIIKKVGQAMLQDEEIGDDFILPLKSQGVHEITNSIMVIRVKFTAKPGKQFVIKREAFRRITEALNAKGIFYAHRKVIVDFPADSPRALADEETRKKALEAGAAAAVAIEADQQKQAQEKEKEE